MKSLNIYGVEQVSRKRRVIAVKFFFDKRIERGGMNLCICRRKLLRVVQNSVKEPIQHGITIIGVFVEEFKSTHDFIKFVKADVQIAQPLMKILF